MSEGPATNRASQTAERTAMLRQMQSPVLPESGRNRHRRAGSRARGPLVERIAGWSAGHRKTAVLVAGQVIGTKNLPAYDPGASGRAEQVLQRAGFTSPPAESVLIQARRPGVSYPASAEMRQAAAQLVAALRSLPASA